MFHIANLYLYHKSKSKCKSKSKSKLLITTIYNNINPFLCEDYSYQMMKCSYPNEVNPSIENKLQWVFCSYLLWAMCNYMTYHAPILSNLKSFQTPYTYYKWFVTITSPKYSFFKCLWLFICTFLAQPEIISSYLHSFQCSIHINLFCRTCNHL